MKVGDPKQARILSVVAVGAVAFVIIQLLPGGGSTVGKVSQQIQDRLKNLNSSNDTNSGAVKSFPPMLSRNVFDHPYLSKTKADAEPEKPTARTDEPDSSSDHSPVPPALPGLPVLEASPIPSSGESKPDLPVQPEVQPVSITVEGVILRPSPTALISVNLESTTPAVGDLVANGYRLYKITEDSVILTRKGKKKTVPVGGSLTL